MRKKILVVREYDNFSLILAASGFEIINLPLIETPPIDDLSEFERRLEAIENYDGIFLTSVQAAQILADKLRVKNANFGGKVYVLGKRSLEILQTQNLDLIFFETANTAREMLERIAANELKNKRFLFICGEKSLRVVPDFLAGVATVDEAVVYETRKMSVGADKIKTIGEKFETGEIGCACFFSPSGAENFIEQFGAEILHQTNIAVIGKTTAEFFDGRNLKADFISSKASAESFAVELIDYLKEELPTKVTKKGKLQ